MRKLRKIILYLIIMCLIIVGIVAYAGYKMYIDAINDMSIDKKVESIRNNSNYVTINKLPKDYLNAVVSIEDHRFYNHGPVDYISIARAFVQNLKEKDLVQGGSTITQQLAKNMYFSQKKEFTRKIAEIFLAYDLENKYSKDEILELYVNTCYFGDGYYGIRQASNGYLNKEPIDMNFSECTLLAGTPNAPTIYAPTKNPELAKERQQQVIASMRKNGYEVKDI